MTAAEEIKAIQKSRCKRFKLKIYAVWLIAGMYYTICRNIFTAPETIRRYVSAELPSLRKEIEARIDGYVLNERDRKMLKRRVLDGIKFEALAEEFELSEKQTRNICGRYKNLIV